MNCEIDVLGTRQETRAIVGGALGGESSNRWFQYEYSNWKGKNNEK